MEHHFNIKIAEDYGIEESIILHNFFYWTSHNAANEVHLHDGLYWHYNSRKAMFELFPYMNETKIFRVIKHLEEKGLIVKGNYNDDKWIKTNWYAITRKGLKYMLENGYKNEEITRLLQNDRIDCVKMNNRLCQNEQSNINNNEYDNNSITDSKQQIETEEKELKEKFAEFVKLYKTLTKKNTRGVDTEFAEFSKRHKNWKEIVPYLSIAIERETKAREQARLSHKFFPEPKMLQTYLGKQKAWELYVTVGDDINAINNEYTPQAYNIALVNGEYLMTGMYFDGDPVLDGYEDDKRPNGATIKLHNSQGYIIWNATSKTWTRYR